METAFGFANMEPLTDVVFFIIVVVAAANK